jgi:hypothetical protein
MGATKVDPAGLVAKGRAPQCVNNKGVPQGCFANGVKNWGTRRGSPKRGPPRQPNNVVPQRGIQMGSTWGTMRRVRDVAPWGNSQKCPPGGSQRGLHWGSPGGVIQGVYPGGSCRGVTQEGPKYGHTVVSYKLSPGCHPGVSPRVVPQGVPHGGPQ